MADTDKLTDERLREIGRQPAYDHYSLEKVEMARELLSRRTSTGEAVAYIERGVLAALTEHKDATGTVASGLLKNPFGDPVALYTHPTTVDDAMVERVWEVVEPLLHPTIDRRSARATLTAALRSTKP